MCEKPTPRVPNTRRHAFKWIENEEFVERTQSRYLDAMQHMAITQKPTNGYRKTTAMRWLMYKYSKNFFKAIVLDGKQSICNVIIIHGNRFSTPIIEQGCIASIEVWPLYFYTSGWTNQTKTRPGTWAVRPTCLHWMT